jgi:hypothetical protein
MIYFVGFILTYILYATYMLLVVHPRLIQNAKTYTGRQPDVLPLVAFLFIALAAAIVWPVSLLLAVPWGIYFYLTGKV